MKCGAVSEPTVVAYERVLAVQAVSLGKLPEERAGDLGPLALVDGKWGNPDPFDRSWLDFARDDLDAVIDFGTARDLRKVGLDIYSDPRPRNIRARGNRIRDVGGWKTLPDGGAPDGEGDFRKSRIGSAGAGTVRFVTRDIKTAKARFLKVKAKNRGYCPAGSPERRRKSPVARRRNRFRIAQAEAAATASRAGP